MDFLEAFLERRKDFNDKVKNEILTELNSHCSNVGIWDYEDGVYIAHSVILDRLFILKGNFEPYVFDCLAVLGRDFAEEMTIDGEPYDLIAGLYEDMIDENSN